MIGRLHKNIPIVKDSDHALDYETNSLIRNIFHRTFIKIISHFSPNFRLLIKKTNKAASHVIDNVTNHNALETLYHTGGTHPPGNFMHRTFQSIWFNVDNSKAVRNRLKLVERELQKISEDLIKLKRPINLLSIASGSARSVVTVFEKIHNKGIQINLTFLDKNQDAIDYSKHLSKNLVQKYHIQWFMDTASNFPRYFNSQKPNIIEMVGLLDYFEDKKVEDIFRLIYHNLETGGSLITANISDNHEKKFITKIIGWKMIYRDATQLIDLAEKAGFETSKMKVYYEPQHIHCVLIAQK